MQDILLLNMSEKQTTTTDEEFDVKRNTNKPFFNCGNI